MNWSPTTKLSSSITLVGLGVVVALATARPEPVVIVTPFAIAIIGAVALTRPFRCSVQRTIDRQIATEGDVVVLTFSIGSDIGVSALEIIVDVPSGCAAPTGAEHTRTSLRAGERTTLEVPLRCDRWGNHVVGGITLRARSALGIFVAVGTFNGDLSLTVYPRPHTLRRLVEPLEPIAIAGDHATRLRATGSEFADLRPYVVGDRARDINWRASARRGALWVDQRHPDRSTDVVLLLDAFSELMLDDAVRVVASLVDRYLAHRDRVGLFRFGGTLAWVGSGTGLRQRYLVVHQLLDTSVFASEAVRSIEQIPSRMLPPRALVIAVSPLLDERMVRLLFDLRARGVDLVVIEMAPTMQVAAHARPIETAAAHLWRLQREVARASMRDVGIPVVQHREGQPLAETLEEVRAWPRRARSLG
ncbi:MAG: DUF58 domain-containing protein [Acidimicrobiia bacterium]